jgi:hypothetical protein
MVAQKVRKCIPQNMKYRGSGNVSPSEGVIAAWTSSVSPQKYSSAIARPRRVQSAYTATIHERSHTWSGNDVPSEKSPGSS